MLIRVPKGYRVELFDDGGWAIYGKKNLAKNFWLNPTSRKKAWQGLLKGLKKL